MANQSLMSERETWRKDKEVQNVGETQQFLEMRNEKRKSYIFLNDAERWAGLQSYMAVAQLLHWVQILRRKRESHEMTDYSTYL